MDITAIVVNHRTPDLIRKAVSSFRAFYPNVAMIVIDNGSGDESTRYISDMSSTDKNVRCILNDRNLGHGPALHQGILASQTRYVFTLDSDCDVKRGGFLEAMLAEFKDDNLYAIGDLCNVNDRGENVIHGYPYIHPFAGLYDRTKYLTLPPFKNHGAPATLNMIAASGNSYYAVKGFDIKAYIDHAWMGTRRVVMSPRQLAVATRSTAEITNGFVNVIYTGGRSGTFGLAGIKSGNRYTVNGIGQPVINDSGQIGIDPRDVERILSINRGKDFVVAVPERIKAAEPLRFAETRRIETHTDAPFMSFVTRIYKRPAQLLRCLESIAQQTDQDYENVLLVDSVGVGVDRANEFFYEHRYRVRGEWVYMIDDDDMMTDFEFVATIKQIVAEYQPDIIIVKARHPMGVLPDAAVWGKKPVGGHIGTPAYIVRRDIWREHIKEFGGHGYAGDYTFGLELFNHDYKIHWLDRIVCSVPRQQIGNPE